MSARSAPVRVLLLGATLALGSCAPQVADLPRSWCTVSVAGTALAVPSPVDLDDLEEDLEELILVGGPFDRSPVLVYVARVERSGEAGWRYRLDGARARFLTAGEGAARLEALSFGPGGARFETVAEGAAGSIAAHLVAALAAVARPARPGEAR